MTPPVIWWIRRDLRLRDNQALAAAIRSGHPVIALFIFDPKLLTGERFSAPRYEWLTAGLRALDSDLRSHGGGMVIRRGDPLETLREVIERTGAVGLYLNADYTPYAHRRDERIKTEIGIAVHRFDDRLLIAPGALLKEDGKPYTVYTPFKKQWRKLPKPAETGEYELSSQTLYSVEQLASDALPSLSDLGYSGTIALPPAGESAGERRTEAYLASRIYRYAERRDYLGSIEDTETSFLSPYLRFGMVSLRRLYWECRTAYEGATTEDGRESVSKFVDELIWHEFYAHILWHFPKVAHGNFNPRYDRVEWVESAEDFAAWKNGETGYPIVDAAMRQLTTTGWMHNRARMIVASFLTKDIRIHWQAGEQFFMQWLLDGDLASNNGGWQWSAGTGTDAQPYFRIFNPVSQSQKFDPTGRFIRRWLPELANVPDEHIHAPWRMPSPPVGYPPPLVDHDQARQATLAAFEVTKNSEG